MTSHSFDYIFVYVPPDSSPSGPPVVTQVVYSSVPHLSDPLWTRPVLIGSRPRLGALGYCRGHSTWSVEGLLSPLTLVGRNYWSYYTCRRHSVCYGSYSNLRCVRKLSRFLLDVFLVVCSFNDIVYLGLCNIVFMSVPSWCWCLGSNVPCTLPLTWVGYEKYLSHGLTCHSIILVSYDDPCPYDTTHFFRWDIWELRVFFLNYTTTFYWVSTISTTKIFKSNLHRR